MSTAQTILLVYGSLSLVFGMALGIPLSRIRMSSPEGPRHLVNAHLSALMQAPMHMGLAFALGFASLAPWLSTATATCLALGSALFVAGMTANWLMDVGDHFAERSKGWYLLSASGPLHLMGACVVLGGVVRAAFS